MSEKHPLDVEALSRGDFIPPERVEQIYGLNRKDPRYPFMLLHLRKYIEDEWVDEDGLGVAVRSHDGGLCLLQDEEVAGYATKYRRDGLSK